jgi:hypothetical protein
MGPEDTPGCSRLKVSGSHICEKNWKPVDARIRLGKAHEDRRGTEGRLDKARG